jgi:hypothetical protein
MTTDLLEAPRPLSVLLVEDDPGDVVIAREASLQTESRPWLTYDTRTGTRTCTVLI